MLDNACKGKQAMMRNTMLICRRLVPDWDIARTKWPWFWTRCSHRPPFACGLAYPRISGPFLEGVYEDSRCLGRMPTGTVGTSLG
jgi:hypothetical protein